VSFRAEIGETHVVSSARWAAFRFAAKAMNACPRSTSPTLSGALS